MSSSLNKSAQSFIFFIKYLIKCDLMCISLSYFSQKHKFINEKKKIIMKRELLETTDFGHMVIDSQ